MPMLLSVSSWGCRNASSSPHETHPGFPLGGPGRCPQSSGVPQGPDANGSTNDPDELREAASSSPAEPSTPPAFREQRPLHRWPLAVPTTPARVPTPGSPRRNRRHRLSEQGSALHRAVLSASSKPPKMSDSSQYLTCYDRRPDNEPYPDRTSSTAPIDRQLPAETSAHTSSA